MDSIELAPPAPDVQYLPAIFRRIERGEIRIPAFQRDFVWSEAQILELLESVYRGYPIGSVLFWKVDGPVLQIERNENIPFPWIDEHYPISFILDGMQRLSSLFGVFHHEGSHQLSRFNVVFDLRNEEFRHCELSQTLEVHLPLSALFSPRRLLKVQANLAEQQDADMLIDRSLALQARFQEYLIPTVTITHRTITQVVEIFERVNSTGTRLSAVDFMRALTWSPGFDLTKEISKLQYGFQQEGFDLPPETLVKVLAVVLDKAPTPYEMLGLRDYESATLHSALVKVQSTLGRAIAFLREEFKILSYDFVPYEGQLLVLAKLFSLVAVPDLDLRAAVSAWFWSISFGEGLRGKPDHYVTRAIRATARSVEGRIESLDSRLNLRLEDLLDRRFIKGKALSAAVASMLAVNEARSLVSGQLIDPEAYMAEFSGENFESLFSLEAVRETVAKNTTSSKVFANVVVVLEAEKKLVADATPKQLIESLIERCGKEEAEEILSSQFISPTAIQALLRERPQAFLYERARALYDAASALTTR